MTLLTDHLNNEMSKLNIERLDKAYLMLTILSEAPDSQLDKIITDKLKSLIGKSIPEIKQGVMWSIDMCVHGGLSSEFALKSLHIFHETMLDGKHEDWTDEDCPWRRDFGNV